MVRQIYPFIGLPSYPLFVLSVQAYCLVCDYYIWDRLEVLENETVALSQK